MKAKYFLLIILSVFLLNATAQTFPEIRSGAKEFEKRKLIVVLQEENADVVKQLTKKGNEGNIEAYKRQIEELNQQIEQMANIFLDQKQDILFKKVSEVEKLQEDKSRDYGIIGFYNLHFNKLINANVKDYSLLWSPLELHDTNYEMNKYDKDYMESNTYMFAGLIENFHGDKIEVTPVCNIYPGKSDLTFGFIYLQTYINGINENLNARFIEDVYDEMDQDPSKIKELTLAVNKDALKEGFTETEIEEMYPYKFKLLSYDEITDLILDRTPGYACLSAYDGTAPYQSFIIDSQTWQILACQNKVSYTTYGSRAINKDLFNRILKDIK